MERGYRLKLKSETTKKSSVGSKLKVWSQDYSMLEKNFPFRWRNRHQRCSYEELQSSRQYSEYDYQVYSESSEKPWKEVIDPTPLKNSSAAKEEPFFCRPTICTEIFTPQKSLNYSSKSL